MPTWVKRTFYGTGWRTESRTRSGRYTGLFDCPRKGGVYAWYGDGKLVYVGSSEMLDVRIKQYFHTGRIAEQPDGFVTPWGTYKELDLKVRLSRYFGDWATLELRLIRRLKPTGNIRHKNPALRATTRKRNRSMTPHHAKDCRYATP